MAPSRVELERLERLERRERRDRDKRAGVGCRCCSPAGENILRARHCTVLYKKSLGLLRLKRTSAVIESFGQLIWARSSTILPPWSISLPPEHTSKHGPTKAQHRRSRRRDHFPAIRTDSDPVHRARGQSRRKQPVLVLAPQPKDRSRRTRAQIPQHHLAEAWRLCPGRYQRGRCQTEQD